LIRLFTCVNEILEPRRGEFAQYLISECIETLANKEISSSLIKRNLKVLSSLIERSETNGMADVQPHAGILKGETLERIIINNTTRPYFPSLVVKVFTSATVWEFVDKVARMCDLAP
jgi:hypothetical protein